MIVLGALGGFIGGFISFVFIVGVLVPTWILIGKGVYSMFS